MIFWSEELRGFTVRKHFAHTVLLVLLGLRLFDYGL